jgi:deoxyribonuclease-4
MRKVGLKLWSSNHDFIPEAYRLFNDGVYDYIELYIVPNSRGLLPLWKKMTIPFIVHAPHFGHDLNLADRNRADSNSKLMSETQTCADELDAPYIIAHPGVNGDIRETARQIGLLKDKRILVENKPFKGFGNVSCVGSKPEEIAYVMEQCGVGSCLDVGHAICAANSHKADHVAFLTEFAALTPSVYHLADGDASSEFDSHEHLGHGNYDFEKLFLLLPKDATITIETEKSSKCDLRDFEQDIENFRKWT